MITAGKHCVFIPADIVFLRWVTIGSGSGAERKLALKKNKRAT